MDTDRVDRTFSAIEIHGEDGNDFLPYSTADLIAMFKAGGQDRISASLELARRKVNRAARAALKG